MEHSSPTQRNTTSQKNSWNIPIRSLSFNGAGVKPGALWSLPLQLASRIIRHTKATFICEEWSHSDTSTLYTTENATGDGLAFSVNVIFWDDNQISHLYENTWSEVASRN
ncbi:hypothetical protein AVEN_58552-1 [Araneus ventricosus]|uniref:Uncharacterized protein n=1 Tax=Araneus ventricosus TaxID=182803 RepID=A0A4Y2PBC1_ARAVE|nr:hypothetical protein AVEN_58552-1 [Araneus ventricosus]